MRYVIAVADPDLEGIEFHKVSGNSDIEAFKEWYKKSNPEYSVEDIDQMFGPTMDSAQSFLRELSFMIGIVQIDE
jgi:hypothetical protein